MTAYMYGGPTQNPNNYKPRPPQFGISEETLKKAAKRACLTYGGDDGIFGFNCFSGALSDLTVQEERISEAVIFALLDGRDWVKWVGKSHWQLKEEPTCTSPFQQRLAKQPFPKTFGRMLVTTGQLLKLSMNMVLLSWSKFVKQKWTGVSKGR